MRGITYPIRRVESALARHRAPTTGWPEFALGAFGVLGLGVAHGGYFASAWGWAIVAFVVVFVWRLMIGATRHPSRSEVVFLGGLLALAIWFALSGLWGPSSAAISEATRVLVYVSGAAAAVSLGSRPNGSALVAGVLAGATGLAAYSLATRLFPDRIGTFDSTAGYRLSAPIGYWNGLGLLCAVAIVLAVGLAATASSPVGAATAAIPVPILVATLYFTFSRGSWLALSLGLAVAIGLDDRRVRLTAISLAAALPAAAGVWVCASSEALTHLEATVTSAAHDGHRVALVLSLCAAGSGLLAAAVSRQQPLSSVSPTVARTYLLVLIGGISTAFVVGLVLAGGPVGLAKGAWRSFDAPPPKTQADLRGRLFSFSGNGRADLFRAALRDARLHPVLGSGAGSFENYWLLHRETALKVRDAHSLYLETFAEAGAVGLCLLLSALVTPLALAVRRRSHPAVPALAGAYLAYLAGAAVDWDWEITSVTLAAIFVAVALLAVSRPVGGRDGSRALRYGGLCTAVLIGSVGFVFLVGNMHLARATAAATSGSWLTPARHEQSATDCLVCSPVPWQQLGEAQLAQGQTRLARGSFRRAITKDDQEWSLWFDLARASSGPAQRDALRQASELDPLSPEIAAFKAELGSNGISISAGLNP
jgi:hypothetical protein